MADTPFKLSSVTDLTEKSAALAASGLSTGDLRRRYDFSDRFGELALAQTPFFRLVSSLSKKPTDDPEFKFTEKRHSWMKRYAYTVGFNNGSADVFNNAQLLDNGAGAVAVGDTVILHFATDYFSAGNIQKVQGKSNGSINV